jgi:SulP family sulfate permease
MPGVLSAAGRLLLVAIIVGGTSIIINVSLAAIIYQGELARFLDRGIALTLTGAVVMAVVGAFAFGYRGTICQPQDAPAIILALAAANVAGAAADPAAERTFSTVAAVVIVAGTASGLAAWLLGRFRLGFIGRFIPFPVLGGFLAATGYLIVLGGLGVALGGSVGLADLPALLEPERLVRWLPWTALALGVALGTRRGARPMLLPLAVVASAAGFYLVLALLGLDLDDARARGLLLGPFRGGGFLPTLDGWRPLDLDLAALAAQAPTILAVVGLACATSLLSASTLEVITGHRIDPDRDLRAVGLCNLAAAATSAPVGYHVLSETIIARQMGSEGRANGLLVAAACLAALVFGASVISALPVGVFALLILAIGFGMLIGPIFDQRRAMPPADYAVVLIVPATTALFGFLWGVAAGLFSAALFFIMTFARIDLVRLETTAARMRSRLERPEAEQAALAQLGRQAAIYVLAGYVFFGTAYRLVGRIEARLGLDPPPRFVVVDFRAVRGLDVSAARALARLDAACRSAGVDLILCGLSDRAARMVAAQAGAASIRTVPSLEDALEAVEAALLAEAPPAAGAPALLDFLRQRNPGAALDGYFETLSVPAGTEVIAQGGQSDSILFLQSGLLRTEFQPPEGPPVVLARCLPGALVGEIGLYAGVPRTARVVAEAESSVLRLDAGAFSRMAGAEPALLADFHQLVAANLARRLRRTTALFADTELQSG